MYINIINALRATSFTTHDVRIDMKRLFIHGNSYYNNIYLDHDNYNGNHKNLRERHKLLSEKRTRSRTRRVVHLNRNRISYYITQNSCLQ